ncbi:MAG: DUF1573 domain-containing protein [Deltaproteobacteria bacterium]|nr:DUF1573 domain-containing protein [Deltaproteobacteria bacterium]
MLWAAGAGAGQAAAGAPELALGETLYDFGTVMEGRSVSHEFVIANKGEAPLLILKKQ